MVTSLGPGCEERAVKSLELFIDYHPPYYLHPSLLPSPHTPIYGHTPPPRLARRVFLYDHGSSSRCLYGKPDWKQLIIRWKGETAL